jgi:hypothetical protein
MKLSKYNNFLEGFSDKEVSILEYNNEEDDSFTLIIGIESGNNFICKHSIAPFHQSKLLSSA